MTNAMKLASVALAALVLSTAFASAGPMSGAVNDAVNDAVQGSQGFPGGGGGGPGDPWLPGGNDDNDDHWWDDLDNIGNDSGNGSGMIDAPVIDVDGKPKINFNGQVLVTPIDINKDVLNSKPGGKPGKLGVKPVKVLDVAIACQVAGTPVEFPDDLLLINQGAALSAGTTIKWKVKSAGQGYVQLASDLPTGGSVKASGVLEGGVEAGKPCTAKIV